MIDVPAWCCPPLDLPRVVRCLTMASMTPAGITPRRRSGTAVGPDGPVPITYWIGEALIEGEEDLGPTEVTRRYVTRKALDSAIADGSALRPLDA